MPTRKRIIIVSGAHRFEKVTEGIYYATASGTMNVGANSPIIVTDDEAIVIDSQITPAAARALVADLKAVTTKPVRYVVDSHYHYDHSFGNQVFPADVQVIGHDNTRRRMLTNVMEQYTFLNSVQPVPARVDALKQRIDQETDPQQKTALERQVANDRGITKGMESVPKPPRADDPTSDGDSPGSIALAEFWHGWGRTMLPAETWSR